VKLPSGFTSIILWDRMPRWVLNTHCSPTVIRGTSATLTGQGCLRGLGRGTKQE
jgi:hypothetical protein